MRAFDRITLTVYRTRFTDDDIHDGEINAEAEMETVDIEIDEPLEKTTGNLQIAEAIVDWLEQEGLEAGPSASWFYDPDGSSIVSYYTGEMEQASAHLPDEAQFIHHVVCDVYAARQRERRRALDRYLSRCKKERA